VAAILIARTASQPGGADFAAGNSDAAATGAGTTIPAVTAISSSSHGNTQAYSASAQLARTIRPALP